MTPDSHKLVTYNFLTRCHISSRWYMRRRPCHRCLPGAGTYQENACFAGLDASHRQGVAKTPCLAQPARMAEILTDPNAWATFALLIGLELVLGIDNVLVISIVTDRLPEKQRPLARTIGLALAMVARILMLFGVSWLQELTYPVFELFGWGPSWRDLILLGGGGFLLYKAVTEIHHVVEGYHEQEKVKKPKTDAFASAITQIVLMDVVFSLDSVITAVGLTDHLVIMVTAVILSFLIIMVYAGTVAEFVKAHPAVKILALSFLVTIGVTLCMESFHAHVPKAYIYLPMGFALAVELLQMRYDYVHRGKGRRDAGADK